MIQHTLKHKNAYFYSMRAVVSTHGLSISQAPLIVYYSLAIFNVTTKMKCLLMLIKFVRQFGKFRSEQMVRMQVINQQPNTIYLETRSLLFGVRDYLQILSIVESLNQNFQQEISLIRSHLKLIIMSVILSFVDQRLNELI